MVSLFVMYNCVCVCAFDTHLHASNVKLPGAKLALVHLQEQNVYLIQRRLIFTGVAFLFLILLALENRYISDV